MSAWEDRLAAEGMPSEINRDRERPKDPRKLDDYLAGPDGNCRPLKSSRGRDSDGTRAERGANFGAWWEAEVSPDADGAAHWRALSDRLKYWVDRAIRQADRADRAALRARGYRRAALWCALLVGMGLPLTAAGLLRRQRLLEALGAKCKKADELAAQARTRAVLTGGQARVLRLWFQGMRQTEIARLEGHSKVTVHWKLRRAVDAIGRLVRDSVDFQAIA